MTCVNNFEIFNVHLIQQNLISHAKFYLIWDQIEPNLVGQFLLNSSVSLIYLASDLYWF